MTSGQVADGFAISVSTMQARARSISKALDLYSFHPAWTLPGKLDENPLVWTIQVDGFLVDAR